MGLVEQQQPKENEQSHGTIIEYPFDGVEDPFLTEEDYDPDLLSRFIEGSPYSRGLTPKQLSDEYHQVISSSIDNRTPFVPFQEWVSDLLTNNPSIMPDELVVRVKGVNRLSRLEQVMANFFKFINFDPRFVSYLDENLITSEYLKTFTSPLIVTYSSLWDKMKAEVKVVELCIANALDERNLGSETNTSPYYEPIVNAFIQERYGLSIPSDHYLHSDSGHKKISETLLENKELFIAIRHKALAEAIIERYVRVLRLSQEVGIFAGGIVEIGSDSSKAIPAALISGEINRMPVTMVYLAINILIASRSKLGYMYFEIIDELIEELQQRLRHNRISQINREQ